MGWPKMREQTPFPRMTETDKATDDVTSGMQGACDGLLTHIVHCDTVRSAPACISVSDFPASVASPSSLLLMVTSSRAARSQSMQCTAHPTLYIFPTDFCLTNTLPLPTIHFSTYIDTLFRKTATVRRTPTSFWLPRLPIRARLRHSVRSRVPFPSRVATTSASKVLWSPGPIATSLAWPFGWIAPTIGSPWPPGGAPSLPR